MLEPPLAVFTEVPFKAGGRTGTLTSVRTVFAGGAASCSSGFRFTPAVTLFAIGRDTGRDTPEVAGGGLVSGGAPGRFVVADDFGAGAWFCFEPPMDPRRDVKDCK